MAGEKFLTPIHCVIMFLVGTIMAHLQVKSQSMKISPYEEHNAIIIRANYASLLTYGMILVIEFGCEIHNQARSIIKRFSPLTGALVAVLHMLLLDSAFGWFTLALWAIALVGTLWWTWQEITEMYQCIKNKIDRYFHNDDIFMQCNDLVKI
ncbi:hypothetical protein L6164_008652 [Bauhinia variegata]|uniref:Uncharacterized protein n=1 Tax=Bauhinia variegata TaxID=167791 RepID=A0ACB9PGJ1_BAUVA|nr:hypothetical protein L6164_008652 [Bauhinia variegata]